MKKLQRMFFAAGIAAFLSTSVFAQNADETKRQSIQVSYLLALGKKATQAEENYWMSQTISGDMVKTLYNNHKNWLLSNLEPRKQMIRQSYFNSYGRQPLDHEINTNLQQNWTYTDWMNNHIAWLKKTPQDYENAIQNAYLNVMNRKATSSELSFWKGKGAVAYYVIAACVEQCKKSGNSSNCASNIFLTSTRFANTINVSPNVGSSAANIIGSAVGNVIAPGGGNVVAAGSANVVAAGGMN